MSDLLNGFNNGRDKSDGIGGNKPIDQLANDVDASESGLHLQNVSDAVCHYWHCLDQYKGKCINVSYWKTCKNRQTER